MKTLWIFVLVYIAMIATSFWEAYSEGDKPWDTGKAGWQVDVLGYKLTAYHFWLFGVMFPALLAIPLVVEGWSKELFGILLCAYLTGLVVEDFFWYVVNPKVKFSQWFTEFSDYYPWIKYRNRKIVPTFYLIAIILSLISWYTLSS